MIITVTNQKGGTGKTTTAAALLSWYATYSRALGVDLDPQCNLTLATGARSSNKTALGLLTGEAEPRDTIQATNYTEENGSAECVAGSPALSSADSIFSEDIGKPYKLREALSELRSEYDHIIIDSPPALGVLSVNALTAADWLIIPVGAGVFFSASPRAALRHYRAGTEIHEPAIKSRGAPAHTAQQPREHLPRLARGTRAGGGTAAHSRIYYGNPRDRHN